MDPFRPVRQDELPRGVQVTRERHPRAGAQNYTIRFRDGAGWETAETAAQAIRAAWQSIAGDEVQAVMTLLNIDRLVPGGADFRPALARYLARVPGYALTYQRRRLAVAFVLGWQAGAAPDASNPYHNQNYRQRPLLEAWECGYRQRPRPPA